MFSCTNAKINFREKEKEVLDQILGNAGRYDARIRPSGINGTGENLLSVCISCASGLDQVGAEWDSGNLCGCFCLGLFEILCNMLSVTPDGPAIVRVNLFVRSIATISDNKMVSGTSSATTMH